MSERFDAAVVGGGIIGTACFHELAKRGMRVCLIEPSAIGEGTTAAGMGHITAMDDSDAQFALTRYSQLLWNDLATHLAGEAEYMPCGAIWVAANATEMAEVERKFTYYSERETPVEVLDARTLAAQEPNLRPGLPGGLLVREDAVVYPPAVARYLASQGHKLGGTIRQGSCVTSVEGQHAQLEDGSLIHATAFVIATGVAADLLAPEAGVLPRKGHLAITDRHPGFLRHQLIELGYLRHAHEPEPESIAFNVQPKLSGQVVIGSSRQFGSSDRSVEDQILSRMLSRVYDYMPGLRSCSLVRSWTGFRPASQDNLPLIGPAEKAENIYLATGHEGLGITTALGTAKIIAKMLTGSDCGIPIEPYLPKRRRQESMHV